MKKISLHMVFIVVLASTPSFAGIYNLELTAGDSYVEARYGADLPLDHGIFSVGLGGIYRDDDYRLVDTKLTVGKELWAPALRINIGLEGVAGELERDQRTGDLMAVGLLVSAIYRLPQTISPIPITLSAAFSYAPDPTCFSDSERYRTVRATLGFRVAKDGEIMLGYRYLYARLHDNRVGWKVSDAVLWVGYRLIY
jgi:hypothetical protein